MPNNFKFTCPHCFTGFDDIVYTAFRNNEKDDIYTISWEYEGEQSEEYTAENVKEYVKSGMWKITD